MPRRVLVVEDEAVILLLLEHLLTSIGCEVVSEADASRAAARVMARETFDLAVVDLRFSVGSGFDVMHALPLNVPVMVSTGYTFSMADVVRATGRAQDRLSVLRKPWNPDLLVREAQRLMNAGPRRAESGPEP